MKSVMETTDRQASVRPPVRPDGPLRVGLIGSGKMGLNHLKAICAAGRAIVVGVADPAASEEDLRPQIGPDAKIFSSASDMLQGAGLDVVQNRCVKIEHARLMGGLHWAGVNTGVISSRRGAT